MAKGKQHKEDEGKVEGMDTPVADLLVGVFFPIKFSCKSVTGMSVPSTCPLSFLCSFLFTPSTVYSNHMVYGHHFVTGAWVATSWPCQGRIMVAWTPYKN